MSQESVAQFLASAKQDEGLRQILKSAINIQTCIALGKNKGYDFTTEELRAELNKMSEEKVAEIINPGIAPRQHINSREFLFK